VNADVRLDPEGEDLPWNRVVELRAMQDDAPRRPLREATEERGTLAKELANVTRTPEASQDIPEDDDDPTIFESISNGPELRSTSRKPRTFLSAFALGTRKTRYFQK
jgi:hypothetical protein